MDETLVDWRSAFRRLAVGTAVVLVGVAVFLAQMLSASRDRYRGAALDTVENLAFNLEQYLVMRIQSADLVLQSAVDEHRRLQVAPAGRSDAFDTALHDLQRRLPDVPLRAANRAGLLVHGTQVEPIKGIDISQRHFFTEANATDALVIGLPLKSRITGRWVLPVVRGLRDAAGAPAGVVYMNFDLAPFVQLFKTQKVGERGAVTLFNADRLVLLRHPPLPQKQDERPPRLVSPITVEALQAGRTSATFTAKSTLDQEERITTFRKLGAYPAYVLVALGTADVFAAWRTELLVSIGVWCLLAAASAALLLQQARAGRAREVAWNAVAAARRTAEDASASKSQFLANMSHEIRTPLNGVLGFAQIGHRDAGNATESRRNFTRILEAGRLLQGLLNDVLDMSKIEAGKLDLAPEPVRVRAAVRHAVELVQDRARDKGLDLRLTVDERVPEQVVLDPLRLGQILLNLLSNAVKFTEVGHVALSVDVVDRQLLAMVTDSGPGMTATQLERLYQPFEQGEAATAKRHGGTGLGLAITRHLVTLMGGTIAVSSRPGAGTAFTVRLPLVDAPADAAASEAPPVSAPVPGVPARSRLAGLRVLVAEDNAINQIVIQGLLELEGAAAEVVPDGHQAVTRVAAQDGHPYHVALLDLMMPGLDGYETARRIRQVDPNLPLIGQTAHAMQEDRARCIDAGMVDRVTKPIDTEELVRSVLRHARRMGWNDRQTTG